MRNPYDVLGVEKTADSADIKKAFRKLAKKYHPDSNKDPKAKDRFAEANQAYEIVGDDTKRAAFDRGEIDAAGKPRASGFEGFGARGGQAYDFSEFAGAGSPFSRFRSAGGGPAAGIDPTDFFSELFGGSRATGGEGPGGLSKGEDVTGSVTVSLSEAVNGTDARVALPSGRVLEVRIPPGIEDNRQIRLKGQGQPGTRGGSAGDALITVRVARHRAFEVDGRDLRLDLPITLYEAVLGGRINVPTLDGAVELNLPAGTRAGKTLRLRGKGLPATGSLPGGDLLVTPRIALPEGGSEALEALARNMRDSDPYNPRAGLE